MKSKNHQIAVFEDDELLITNISWKLKHVGTITPSSSLENALDILKAIKFDLAIIDLHLNLMDESGKILILQCKKMNIPVIVISSDERPEMVDQLYGLGVKHFLRKKDFLDLLLHYVQNILKTNDRDYFSRFFKTKFLTQNQKLQNDIQNLWSQPLRGESLHLSGPSGSGKSLIAQLYHEEAFGKAPFIHLNCAEIPENLMESELFGHVKGAFTHAEKNHLGKIALANNGTLFLDEIGSLSLNLQAKLLKVLETKTFYPVGSNEIVRVNFTLITATWENLPKKIEQGLFRLDLYQRIKHFVLNLPSLSERPEDIMFFINQWMKNYPRHFQLTEDAKMHLAKYNFPGNMRELKSLLTQMAQTVDGKVSEESLRSNMIRYDATFMADPTSTTTIDYNLVKQLGMKKFLKQMEKQIVMKSFENNRGQVTAVMQELKLSPSSFYRITHLT